MKKVISLYLLLVCLYQPLSGQILKVFDPFEKKGKIEIPFEYENDLLVVKVVFNGIFPLKFIFDTGAEHTILTRREITDLLAVNYRRKFTLYGADLTTPLTAYLATGISMEVGNLLVNHQNMLVLEEDYLNFDEFNGIDVHGILGADMFRRFVVTINYPRRTIQLTPANKFKPPKKNWEQYPIEIHRSKPYLNVPISTPGQDIMVATKLLVDSGSSLPLIIYPETVAGLTIPENTIPAELGLGLGGYLEGVIGRVGKMEIGQTQLIDVVTSFQSLSISLDSNALNNRNGIIGNKTLEHFHIIIDYINDVFYLKPLNKRKPPKFQFDKSGLFIVAGGKNVNKFKIASVVPNSPGEEAGLQKGDDIMAINGFPLSLSRLSAIQRKFRKKEGKVFKITYKRDGQRYKTEIILKKLI